MLTTVQQSQKLLPVSTRYVRRRNLELSHSCLRIREKGLGFNQLDLLQFQLSVYMLDRHIKKHLTRLYWYTHQAHELCTYTVHVNIFIACMSSLRCTPLYHSKTCVWLPTLYTYLSPGPGLSVGRFERYYQLSPGCDAWECPPAPSPSPPGSHCGFSTLSPSRCMTAASARLLSRHPTFLEAALPAELPHWPCSLHVVQ